MDSQLFLDLLEEAGFDFFTGVPCSYLKAFITTLNQRYKEIPHRHVPAVREDVAVGLAAGAFLAGKTPVVYMQNSGLGYSLEAIASLHLIYSFPTLILVTYRGPNDLGMEEHQVMGQHTESLLKTFKINYSIFDGKITGEQLQHIKEYLTQKQLPYALLVKFGAF